MNMTHNTAAYSWRLSLHIGDIVWGLISSTNINIGLILCSTDS